MLLLLPGNPALAAVVADRDPAGDKIQTEEHFLFYEIIVPRQWGEGSLSLSSCHLVWDIDTVTAVHTKAGHWVAKAPAFWMEN